MSYKEGSESEAEVVSFNAWCLKKVAAVPRFHFWYLTLQLELLLLVFVRCLREANFVVKDCSMVLWTGPYELC